MKAAGQGHPAADDAQGPDDLEGGLGYVKPRTYEEFRAVMSSASVRLPRQLRQVAAFIARNPSEVAVGNTIEISRKAGVQPSTLVRFAQSFGYPGFGELQDVFKGYVKINWPEARGRAAPLAEAVAADDPDLRMIAGLVQAATLSLARVPDRIDLAVFDRIAGAMAEADTIYLVGSKRAFPVTMYMALALSQLDIKNSLVDNVGSIGFEQLGFASPRDAVVAISFSPYNSITPALAARAAQAGAAVLGITDGAMSPLAAISQAWLEIAEPDFGGFHTLAATMAIGMSLVLSVVRRRQT